VTPRRWVDDTGDVETLDSADKDLKSFSLMHVTSLPELSKARNSWPELKFGGGTEKGLILVCLSRGSHLLLSFADDSQPLRLFAGGSHPLLRFAGRNRECFVRGSDSSTWGAFRSGATQGPGRCPEGASRWTQD
jgi:hypothetical protein